MIVMREQARDEDAPSRGAQAVYASIGDINAGAMPTRRNLIQHAFIVRDQNAGGTNCEGVPFERAERKRRLDDVEFILSDGLCCGSQ